ncbi:MAG: secreted serine protease, trypsin-like serine protease [Actinomycetota bacterium]
MQFDDADGEADGTSDPAPVPPHERLWRHPSEVAAHAWAASEPPLVLGRGLATATGAIAVVLSVVLAFTTLSTHPGQPTAAIATAVRYAAASVDPSPTPLGDSPSEVAPDTAAPPATPVPAAADPLPTFRVQSVATAGITDVAAATAVNPVAIAVGDGALIITTIAAVDDRRQVQLIDAAGHAATARVLFADESSGLAVLLPDATASIIGVEVAESVVVGDLLSVPGRTAEPVEVAPQGLEPGDTINEQDHMVTALDELLSVSDEPAEGEPVLNQDGELVALCTRGTDGPMVVLIDRIIELRRALGALLRPTVWLGVLIDDQPSGSITVAAIDPDGPAAMAGLGVGDIITAVDGTAIGSSVELAGALALHHVGDVVEISVQRLDGTSALISVELAAPPSRL